jgi:hypothetical protein
MVLCELSCPIGVPILTVFHGHIIYALQMGWMALRQFVI